MKYKPGDLVKVNWLFSSNGTYYKVGMIWHKVKKDINNHKGYIVFVRNNRELGSHWFEDSIVGPINKKDTTGIKRIFKLSFLLSSNMIVRELGRTL
jgi:hypothetical protein